MNKPHIKYCLGLLFSLLLTVSPPTLAASDLALMRKPNNIKNLMKKVFTTKEIEEFSALTNTDTWSIHQWQYIPTFNLNLLLNAGANRLKNSQHSTHPLLKALWLIAQKEQEFPQNIWIPILRSELLLDLIFNLQKRDIIIEHLPKVINSFERDQEWAAAMVIASSRFRYHSNRNREQIRNALLQSCILGANKNVDTTTCESQARELLQAKIQLLSAHTASPGEEVLTVTYQNTNSLEFAIYEVKEGVGTKVFLSKDFLDKNPPIKRIKKKVKRPNQLLWHKEHFAFADLGTGNFIVNVTPDANSTATRQERFSYSDLFAHKVTIPGQMDYLVVINSKNHKPCNNATISNAISRKVLGQTSTNGVLNLTKEMRDPLLIVHGEQELMFANRSQEESTPIAAKFTKTELGWSFIGNSPKGCKQGTIAFDLTPAQGKEYKLYFSCNLLGNFTGLIPKDIESVSHDGKNFTGANINGANITGKKISDLNDRIAPGQPPLPLTIVTDPSSRQLNKKIQIRIGSPDQINLTNIQWTLTRTTHLPPWWHLKNDLKPPTSEVIAKGNAPLQRDNTLSLLPSAPQSLPQWKLFEYSYHLFVAATSKDNRAISSGTATWQLAWNDIKFSSPLDSTPRSFSPQQTIEVMASSIGKKPFTSIEGKWKIESIREPDDYNLYPKPHSPYPNYDLTDADERPLQTKMTFAYGAKMLLAKTNETIVETDFHLNHSEPLHIPLTGLQADAYRLTISGTSNAGEKFYYFRNIYIDDSIQNRFIELDEPVAALEKFLPNDLSMGQVLCFFRDHWPQWQALRPHLKCSKNDQETRLRLWSMHQRTPVEIDINN